VVRFLVTLPLFDIKLIFLYILLNSLIMFSNLSFGKFDKLLVNNNIIQQYQDNYLCL